MKASQRDQLLQTLQARFDRNRDRHKGISWEKVLAKLQSAPGALETLGRMEATGGEPDVIGQDSTGKFLFCDCSAESPSGRRSLCYDAEALDARKENKPQGSAVELAAGMGVELLSEEAYRALQELGAFDAKTSSWIATPGDVRSLGGALFCDRRYGRVFVYHNGAQSYYAASFYARLDKPSWAPPATLFGPVWSVLYAFMGIALALIAATAIAFRRVSRLAALLLVPYLLWVGFASVLTWTLWRANPGLL